MLEEKDLLEVVKLMANRCPNEYFEDVPKEDLSKHHEDCALCWYNVLKKRAEKRGEI